ncbi:MAG: hypothetical protein CMO01_26700 [Thalassobius sp.]|nr:hypothetical protein [Thalassovita sp.]
MPFWQTSVFQLKAAAFFCFIINLTETSFIKSFSTKEAAAPEVLVYRYLSICYGYQYLIAPVTDSHNKGYT